MCIECFDEPSRVMREMSTTTMVEQTKNLVELTQTIPVAPIEFETRSLYDAFYASAYDQVKANMVETQKKLNNEIEMWNSINEFEGRLDYLEVINEFAGEKDKVTIHKDIDNFVKNRSEQIDKELAAPKVIDMVHIKNLFDATNKNIFLSGKDDGLSKAFNDEELYEAMKINSGKLIIISNSEKIEHDKEKNSN